MSKLQVLEDGSHAFYCPGCEFYHRYDSRWTFNGNLDKPSFTPSLLNHYPGVTDRQRCHMYVTDGKMIFLSDCTHDLAGHTVEMEDET